MQATHSARIILLLLAICVFALAVTGSPIYSRLVYLWLFLFLGNWVLAATSLRGLTVARVPRALRAQVGQVFEERFDVINASRLPRLWVEVRDGSSLPDSQGSHVITLVGGKRTRTYRAISELTQRGVFTLGPTVIHAGDPFGLFVATRSIDTDQSLLVYPMMFNVRSFPSPMGLLPGGEALRRKTHHITANAAGVREYAPGDALSRIHWVSTARRDKLIVKEFELDPLAQVWILLDAARASQASLPAERRSSNPRDFWRRKQKFTLPPSTEEYAVSIAASLAQYFLRLGRAVGFVAYGDSYKFLPAEPGGRQLGKILESLALIRAEGKLSLQAVALAQSQQMPRGSTVIVVSPSSHPRVVSAIDQLTRRGLRPVLVQIDSATFGGAPGAATVRAAVEVAHVPVRTVAYGDDLETALSNAA